MEKLIGLDIGTAGCKALVFDSDGKLLAWAFREYSIEFPHPQWAEQDLDIVWQKAMEAMAETIEKAGVSEVAAVSLSVHGEAVTPVDDQGNPLRATILGMDTRTGAQNEWLRSQFGDEALFQLTGMPIYTVNTLPKLLWIKENEPEIWKNTSQFLLVEDFLIRKMTGQAVISQCLASRSQMFDLTNGAWSSEILERIGLDVSRLADVQQSGTPIAEMKSELARELNLSNTPLIVTGGHDQACGALGVGLTQPRLAMVSTGTAEVMEVVLDSPLVSRPLFEGKTSVYHHVVPGLFLAMTLNHSGGIALRWFRDSFCEPQVAEALIRGKDAYDLILESGDRKPTGLLVLPHFSGSGTPTFDGKSKAAILGLTFSTSRNDIARAILEGLTYELRLNLDILKEGGVPVEVLRAIGGGAKSELWCQMKADITGIPVVRPKITEAAGFGAAILAGVGAGIYPSAAEAANRFLVLEEEFLPEPSQKSAYDRLYNLYRKVYPAVSFISHSLY